MIRIQQYGLIAVLVLFFSCESNHSTVCDHIEPDQLCMDYKTSDIGLQTWYKSGDYFIVHISNNQDGNPYIPLIDIYFRLFDHGDEFLPQTGSYKAVPYINASLATKQFDVDFYIDGVEDYMLDLSSGSSFEIEAMNGTAMDGKAFCYFKHETNGSDKKQLNLNFQGAIFQ